MLDLLPPTHPFTVGLQVGQRAATHIVIGAQHSVEDFKQLCGRWVWRIEGEEPRTGTAFADNLEVAIWSRNREK